MKVRVDPELCAGFGICTGIAPEVFELHEDGYATVLVGEVPSELEDLVRRAADQCPARAILLSDDAAGWPGLTHDGEPEGVGVRR